MDKISIIISVISIVFSIFVLILKVFQIKLEKNSIKEKNNINNIKIAKPSYEEYLNMTKISSTKNTTKRKKGDFFDFVFTNLKNRTEYIENRILKIYGKKY